MEVPVACEATKWLIWPSRKRGSQEEIDENHNHSGEATSSSDSYEVNANGYGALRRTVVRQSKRDRDNNCELSITLITLSKQNLIT